MKPVKCSIRTGNYIENSSDIGFIEELDWIRARLELISQPNGVASGITSRAMD
jgi:hypothetical protein